MTKICTGKEAFLAKAILRFTGQEPLLERDDGLLETTEYRELCKVNPHCRKAIETLPDDTILRQICPELKMVIEDAIKRAKKFLGTERS